MERFEQESDTVTDRTTGLMWTRNAAVFDLPMTWTETLEAIRGANAGGWGGFQDWRLPNRRELFSLVSHRSINPCLPPHHPFDSVFPGYYWTSTTCSRLPDEAWTLHMGGARIHRGMKYASYLAWPVRSAGIGAGVWQTGQLACYDDCGGEIPCMGTGQDGDTKGGRAWDESRFSVRADTVLDRLTRLEWIRHADAAGGPVDWETAFRVVDTLNRDRISGKGDWRLPSVRELESLTDMSAHSPALPPFHPFLDVRPHYWSSTTSRYETRYSWALYLEDGGVGVGFKPLADFFVWAVRG
ncbi:MAG: DUF1566 domain-containing protein, partial [Desulfobacterales bacterium]